MSNEIDVVDLGNDRWECSAQGKTTRVVTAVSASLAVEAYLKPPVVLRAPQTNGVYSLREICENLRLLDSPQLLIHIDDKSSVIQDAHINHEELLTIPGIAETQWRYLRTTEEWIPLFTYSHLNTRPITDFVDVGPEIDMDGKKTEELWVTPKGFPRIQYGCQKQAAED